jgi:hypothetical protein
VYSCLPADCHCYLIWLLVLPLDVSYTWPFHLLLFSVNLPYKTPIIPCTKFHINFPLCRSFQRIHWSPMPCVTFHKKLVYNSKEQLVPCPTPRLEDNPLLVVHDFLFSIFTGTLHIWWPSHPSASWRDTLLLWQTHIMWMREVTYIYCRLIQKVCKVC